MALFITEWLQGAKKVSWSACCGASTNVRVISINWKNKPTHFVEQDLKNIVNYHLVIIIHYICNDYCNNFTLSGSDQLEKHFLIHMNLPGIFEFPPKTKKLHLPNGQVMIRIHKPDYKNQPRATGHNIFFACWIDIDPWKIQMPWRWSQSILYYDHCATQSTTTYLVIKTWWKCNATAVIYKI